MAGPLAAGNTFKLTVDQDTFDLDVHGNALQGGAVVGAWKTNADNNIVITRQSGVSAVAKAGWKFTNNQLVLISGGAEVFNFQSNASLRPRFETRNAVLRVTPDTATPFAFDLRGEWDFTQDHDLRFTPKGGEASLITGFVNSPEGKFIFFFADKKRPMLKHKLGFAGQWENAIDGDGNPKEGQVAFHYRREDGTMDVFELPGRIKIHRATNQLRYEYQKGGTQAIDFVGTLVISEDFTISYALSKRFSNTGEVLVNSTTLSFGAAFHNDKFDGDLELLLTKADGTPGTTKLTVRGTFAGVLGATKLQAGFTFDQVREGQTITTTFGFAGSLEVKGSTIQWAFAATGTGARTVDVSAQITLGSVVLDPRLKLTMANGAVQGVTVFLGTQF